MLLGFLCISCIVVFAAIVFRVLGDCAHSYLVSRSIQKNKKTTSVKLFYEMERLIKSNCECEKVENSKNGTVTYCFRRENSDFIFKLVGIDNWFGKWGVSAELNSYMIDYHCGASMMRHQSKAQLPKILMGKLFSIAQKRYKNDEKLRLKRKKLRAQEEGIRGTESMLKELKKDK